MLSPTQYRQIWKTAFLPIGDFGMLVLSAMIGYWLRYKFLETNFEGIKKVFGWDYLSVSLILSFFVVIIYSFFGLYKINQKHSIWQTIFQIIIGIWLVLLGTITFLFFNEYNKSTLPDGVVISRFILGIVGFLAIFFVLWGRSIFWSLEQIFYLCGFFKVQIVVIGENQINFKTRSDIAKILYYKELNPKNLEFLKLQIENQKIAEIYIFGQNNSLEISLAEIAEKHKVSYIFSPPSLTQYQNFGLNSIILDGHYFFGLTYSPLFGWQIVFKRLFDIVFSFLFLVIFSPLFLIIAIIIKMESKGSVFYASERIGPNGQVFKLWKFRRFHSQFCTSESKPESLEIEQKLIQKLGQKADRGALYKIKNDPRSTRFGTFLEKTSLDELPQFWNVLIGNLSIVGPRPHQPREVQKYSKHHYKVLNILPGITGMAQINGRSDLSFEEEVKLDTKYVESWSFWLDLWIIIRTPFILIFKRHR